MQIETQAAAHYDVGFHQVPLVTSWFMLANCTLVLSALKWKRYSFYVHALIGLLIIGLTLSGTLHVLFDVGINYKSHRRFQKIHNVGGLILTLWLTVQVGMGILSRRVQCSEKYSVDFCKWAKRAHRWSGYLLMVLGKMEYSLIYYRRGKFLKIMGFLLVDFTFILLYLWLKFRYENLQQSIVESQLIDRKEDISEQNFLGNIYQRLRSQFDGLRRNCKKTTFDIPQIKYLPVILHSEQQIPITNFFLFNDYVYNSSPIQSVHPGGQKVIELIRGREVDRFLYGFYPLQLVSPELISHKHSKQSLRVCQQPIARIERISPIKGFKAQFIKVKIVQSQRIHKNSPIHKIHLKPTANLCEDWTHFRYQGFTDEKQLGQYFSLTICDGNQRLTRLYTAVWCMRPQNLQLMSTQFPSGKISEVPLSFDQINIHTQAQIQNPNEEVIPLVIKKFQKGQMTSKLLGNTKLNQIIVSKPMGAGLRYKDLPDEGKVIIISGGTGLLPFCDLIDLLFKRVKMLTNPNASQHLSDIDSLTKKDLIKNRRFILYHACQGLQDILKLTLDQINYLSQNKLIYFESFVRVKRLDLMQKRLYPKIVFQEDYFNQQIAEHLQNFDSIAKIYICGTHTMNYSIGQTLRTKNIPDHLYLFV